MSVLMSEELKQLATAAHGLLQKAAGPTAFRAVRDAGGDGFSRDLWAQMVELGWGGLAIPEVLGGFDMGPSAVVLVADALGAHLAAAPFVSTAVFGATALAAGDEAQADRLAQLAAGELVLGIPLDAGGGAPSLSAEPDGDGFRLFGTQRHLLDLPGADAALLWARTGEGTTAFVVPAEALRAQAEVTTLIDHRRAAAVTLEGVEVGPEHRVGAAGEGEAVLASALALGRAAAAAEMVGAARAVFESTLDYMRDRKQFGAPIGSFQALQHRAAHLHTELTIAGAMVRKAADAIASDQDAARMVAAAKAKAGQVAVLAANEAIQLHGGVGVTDEYDVGMFVKRIRTLENTFGDTRRCRDLHARCLGF